MNAFYRQYLDADINRIGTNCEKWDRLEEHFGRGDLVAAWVADMDFRTVPAVVDALAARVQHGIFGYTENGEADKAAEIGWLKRRHGVDVSPDWILYSPGVVDSLFFCVRALTAPGDAILIQTPVYGPFYAAVNKFGRKLVESPLIEDEAGWRMDFDDVERKFREGVKMMILCSPHNPIGRVWTRDELTRLTALANRYGVLVLSDEIHADFTFDGHRQTRILDVEGRAQRDHAHLGDEVVQSGGPAPVVVHRAGQGAARGRRGRNRPRARLLAQHLRRHRAATAYREGRRMDGRRDRIRPRKPRPRRGLPEGKPA